MEEMRCVEVDISIYTWIFLEIMLALVLIDWPVALDSMEFLPRQVDTFLFLEFSSSAMLIPLFCK
jgi:hypothetical protein